MLKITGSSCYLLFCFNCMIFLHQKIQKHITQSFFCRTRCTVSNHWYFRATSRFSVHFAPYLNTDEWIEQHIKMQVRYLVSINITVSSLIFKCWTFVTQFFIHKFVDYTALILIFDFCQQISHNFTNQELTNFDLV